MSSSDSSASRVLVGGSHVAVTPRWLDRRVALLSIDVETDYGTGRRDALGQVSRLLDLLDELRLPLTAFVEGMLFEREPGLCRLLADRGVDLQLHVYDHSTAGDTPESLARGARAYEAFLGRRPEGYRAHTYRLTPALFDALVDLGFKWDSSLMRGLGLGHNADPAFRRGDYFEMVGLIALPMGVWRFVRLPLNHPYSLLAGSLGARVLRSVCGPSNRLVACNVHMTDLVRSEALAAARYGTLFRAMQQWMWLGHGADTFTPFAALCRYLRDAGHTFMTSSQCYAALTSPGSSRPSPLPAAR
jgi:peptidoglycan/xylan/chitin deacetylase (PgdA/CDA1 family)